MDLAAVFADLRRRRVFRVAAVYAAAAFVVAQIADIAIPGLHLPEWSLTLVLTLLLLGFPIALVLAWAYDITPHGVVRTDAAAASAVAEPAAAPPSHAPAAVDSRSIAALPFANLSGDPDNEYFSDGITDEILMTLANIGDLQVISRTSVMQYKRTTKPIRQIAAELGVAHILEGSVQRAGNQVRITAQLIDANTDAHLWAQRYDRPLEDIFAVQSEIAQQIARALHARLSPTEQARLERRPTTNLTAYEHVLRAREFLRRITPREVELEAALALLRRARELDPTYPDVFVSLSEAYWLQYILLGDRAWLDASVAEAERAVELDPLFAPGHSALGKAHEWRGERDAALAAHARAVELNPNVSEGLANVYHYGFGRLDEAARWWGPALKGDPTNSHTYWLAGRTFLNLGMIARARLLLENAVEFQPDAAWPHYNLSTVFLLEGKPGDARAQIQRMIAATGSSPDALLFAGHGALAMGNLQAARRYFEQCPPEAPAWHRAWGTLGLAWVLRQSGETAAARELTGDAARQLEHRWGGPPKRLEDYADLARVRVLEGDQEGALQAFGESVHQGWRFSNEGVNEVILESLQGDPRYDRLMAEVKADLARQRARVEREGW